MSQLCFIILWVIKKIKQKRRVKVIGLTQSSQKQYARKYSVVHYDINIDVNGTKEDIFNYIAISVPFILYYV